MPSPAIVKPDPAPTSHVQAKAFDQGHEVKAEEKAVIRQAIEAPIDSDARQFTVTPGIGIAPYPAHSTSGQTQIAHADVAMGRARQLCSPHEFFEPSMASGTALPLPTD